MPGSAFERAFHNAARSEPRLLSAAIAPVAPPHVQGPGAVPWHQRKSSRIGGAALLALVVGALLLFSCEPTARVKQSTEAGEKAGGKSGARAGERAGGKARSKSDGQAASGVTGNVGNVADQGLGDIPFNSNAFSVPSVFGGSPSPSGGAAFSFTPPGTSTEPRPAPSQSPAPATGNGTARPDASSGL